MEMAFTTFQIYTVADFFLLEEGISELFASEEKTASFLNLSPWVVFIDLFISNMYENGK